MTLFSFEKTARENFLSGKSSSATIFYIYTGMIMTFHDSGNIIRNLTQLFYCYFTRIRKNCA